MNGLVVSVYVCLLVRRTSVMCVEEELRKGRGGGGHCMRGTITSTKKMFN